MQITLETKPFVKTGDRCLGLLRFEDDDPVQGRIAEIDQAAAGY